MAKQNINIGVNPNDGTGDVVREAFRKSKENFDELYARPTGDMNKSTYDSDNSGAVDQADKITGVDAAGNVTYYGKDAAGNIGFHTFSPDKVDSYTDFASFPAAGFEGVVYIDLENLALYLWDDVNEVYVKTDKGFNTEGNLTADLNTLETGSTFYGSGSTNKPSTSGGWVITQKLDSLFKTQIATDTYNKTFTRYSTNGTYGAWRELAAERRDEKYIQAANYTLVAEDRSKFLSIRITDTTITIPTGVFNNGDIIKGFCYSARATIVSNLGYNPRPMGTTNKCWGYFEIRISSTDNQNPNADAAIMVGDFIRDRNFLKSPNGVIWEIEVSDAGVMSATNRGLTY
jgi:hypothetical protein